MISQKELKKFDMKFTIFTPFYNYLDALDTLYEAIKNQTYSDWEWLVLDDFSDSDDVITRLKEISSKDERVKVIYPKWKKQYFYNLPVEYSTGDIIVKQDSDDIPSIKLLEVYNYIYRKFPDLVSVGSSSLFVNDSFSGDVTGAKYINYKNSSNYLESEKNKVYYSIGDARSYRISKLHNKGIFVGENDPKFIFGEDYVKTLSIEEFGKYVALPRILHRYSVRQNSNSGSTSVNQIYGEEDKKLNYSILDYYSTKAKKRVDRKTLVSIEDYYDGSFTHLKNFYFTGVENESSKKNIEYWSESLMARDIQKIQDLYFDHNIFFNEKIDSPNLIIIDSDSDDNLLLKTLSDRKLTNCTITITSDKEKYEHNSNIVKSLGYGYWFNIHNYATIKISK